MSEPTSLTNLPNNLLELVHLASELQWFQGYLTTEDLTRKNEVQARFDKMRNKLAYVLLQNVFNANAAEALVDGELDRLETEGDESWSEAIQVVRESLRVRLRQQERASPTLRRIFRWAPPALIATLVLAYFGVRLMSAITISEPIESAPGLQQRAAAAKKVLRYDGGMSTQVRKGGWLKGILFWPIEPTEAEIKAAQEFASLVLDGYDRLASDGVVCGLEASRAGSNLTDQEMGLIGNVADHLRADGVRWADPPILTVLEPIRVIYTCEPASGANGVPASE